MMPMLRSCSLLARRDLRDQVMPRTSLCAEGMPPRGGAAGVCAALILGALLGGCWPDAAAITPVQPPPKDPNIIRVSADQMHQLNIVKVEPYSFRIHKPAIGQIAFNEDASTIVQTPFSGRVTRVL